MTQQGKQGSAGVCKGFPCNSVKLGLLANSNRHEVDPNTCFLSGKALFLNKILPCMDSDLFCHTFASVICGIARWNLNSTVDAQTASRAS